MGDNPLVGVNDDRLGPRFPDMSAPYTPELIEVGLEVARRENFVAHRGVTVAVTGPNLETRAEYRFLRQIGADVVGMSTVPEVIVAVHAGMRVFGLSVVTDMCLPDALKPANVEEIIAVANAAQPKLRALVMGVLAHEAGRSKSSTLSPRGQRGVRVGTRCDRPSRLPRDRRASSVRLMLHLAAQIAEAADAVRRRWSETPRAGIILGSGLGDLANEIDAEATIDYADIPALPAHHGHRPRRQARVRHARRRAGRRVSGPLPPVRRPLARAGRHAGAAAQGPRRRRADRLQRRRRTEPAVRHRRRDADRRPDQPHVRQPAGGRERRRARPAVSRHVVAVRSRAATARRSKSPCAKASSCTAACTSPCWGRTTKRGPSTACCAGSAATPSACRPCPK